MSVKTQWFFLSCITFEDPTVFIFSCNTGYEWSFQAKQSEGSQIKSWHFWKSYWYEKVVSFSLNYFSMEQLLTTNKYDNLRNYLSWMRMGSGRTVSPPHLCTVFIWTWGVNHVHKRKRKKRDRKDVVERRPFFRTIDLSTKRIIDSKNSNMIYLYCQNRPRKKRDERQTMKQEIKVKA